MYCSAKTSYIIYGGMSCGQFGVFDEVTHVYYNCIEIFSCCVFWQKGFR